MSEEIQLVSLGVSELHLELSYQQSALAMRASNLYYLGDEVANEFLNGKYVSKYPHLETPEFKEATHALHRTTTVTVEVFLNPATGEVTAKQVVTR